MRLRRWSRFIRVVVAALVAATAATVIAVAVNVATGGTSPWFPLVEARPLWWVAGGTAMVAVAGVSTWWTQRQADRGLEELVPAEQRPEPWVVDRPVEVGLVVNALRRRRAAVGITTAVQGAGGFGKTTVAKLVRADPRILRRFGNRVYWVTLGRDVRTGAAIAAKVNDLIARIAPQYPATFTDPLQAGEQLAALLAAGPPRLLILDDVWYPEQVAAFPLGGRRTARLLTTRISSVVAGKSVPVRVDAVTPEQAEALLTSGLPPLARSLVDALMAETGRWPLLLRLVNKVLADQAKAEPDIGAAARDLLARLRRSGPLHVDRLTGAAGRQLDINDPHQRQLAVTATIEASTDLLTPPERNRFTELAIFAEDETVPVDLIGQLWRDTGDLDMLQTRSLCARLDELALLTLADGTVRIHDVIRDFLHDELDPEHRTTLHRVLLRTVSEHLAPAQPLRPDAAGPETAWWELDLTARYLWDHLIEHLLSADRTGEAEALAEDLRWTTMRLVHSGPDGVNADLALVNTPRCRSLRQLVGQYTHLLAPTDPPQNRADVLLSRIAHDPWWGPAVEALTRVNLRPRLTNRWPLPDLVDPAQRWTVSVPTDQSDHGGNLAIGPDGTWIAVLSGTLVRIFDTTTWTEQTALTGHTYSVKGVAVSADGTWLATSSDDKTVRVWDTATWTEKAVLRHQGADDYPKHVAIAPDGTWLAVVTGFQVLIWDVVRQTKHRALRHREGAKTVAIAPDGTWLVSAADDSTLRFWDTTTWTEVGKVGGGRRIRVTTAVDPDATNMTAMDAPYVRHTRAMAIAPDGCWLAEGGEKEIRIWDTDKLTLIKTIDYSIVDLAIAPDGTRLVACGGDGTVRTWDTRRVLKLRRANHAVFTGHHATVYGVAIAPDSTWMVTTGGDATLRAWDLTSINGRGDLDLGKQDTTIVAVLRKGLWMASAHQSGRGDTVRIWDVDTGIKVAEFGNSPGVKYKHEHYGVGQIAASADGSLLVTTDKFNNGRILIWDTTENPGDVHLPRLVVEDQQALANATAVAVAPSGSWIATGASRLRIWSTPDRRFQTELVHKTRFAWLGPIDSIVVSPDEAWLATARGGSIRIWDSTTWTQKHKIIAGRPLLAQRSLTIAPDGTWIASIDQFRHGLKISIWKTETWELRQVRIVDSTSSVEGAAVSPNGRWIAAVDDRALHIPGRGHRPDKRHDPGRRRRVDMRLDARRPIGCRRWSCRFVLVRLPSGNTRESAVIARHKINILKGGCYGGCGSRWIPRTRDPRSGAATRSRTWPCRRSPDGGRAR